MTIRLFALGIILLLATGRSTAQVEYNALLIPPALKKNASSCVRAYEHTFEMKDDRSGTVKVRKVITLLDGGHDGANRLVVNYDNESKVTNFKATVYDAMGKKIRHAKKSEIEDVKVDGPINFMTDNRVMTVVVDYLSYPYTVEYEYEKKVKDMGMVSEFPRWLPVDYNQSLVKGTYTMVVPAGKKISYWLNAMKEPKMTTEEGNQVYVWEVADLPALVHESESPPSFHVLPTLIAHPERFETNGYQGNYESWEAFGKYTYNLYADRREVPESLREEIRSLTTGLSEDREKIDALYRYLQKNTRYVSVQLGIGGWQPFSPVYVRENSYGDCKALSNYMGAMLSEVGIEAYPVKVFSGDRLPFLGYEDYVVSMFNHIILYVPSEDMYLECTSSDSPTGYLGESNADRHVLWITPEGGWLTKTPALKPADNGYTRTTRLELTPGGETNYQQHVSYYGAEHEFLRGLVAYDTDLNKQKEILHHRDYLPDVQGNMHLSVAYDAPTAELTYTTQLPNYARKRGTRMFVSLNKYDPWDWVPDQLEKRTQPIHSRLTRFYVDTVQLVLPESMEVESMGDTETVLEHAVGEYRAKISVSGNELTWIRTFKMVPVELPAEAYADYRQFFVDVVKAEKKRVVLKERRTK